MVIDISSNTIKLRRAHHMSQQEVAEAIKMDITEYKRLENGDYSPSYEVIMELSALYKVPVSKINDKSRRDVDDLLKKFIGPNASIIETDRYIEFKFNH